MLAAEGYKKEEFALLTRKISGERGWHMTVFTSKQSSANYGDLLQRFDQQWGGCRLYWTYGQRASYIRSTKESARVAVNSSLHGPPTGGGRLKVAQAHDRRNIKALLAELKQALEATPTEANMLKVLKLQGDLIAFLVGQLGSLQMQVELLMRADERPK